MAIFGLFGGQNKGDLERGLEKTKDSVIKRISRAVIGKTTVDDEVLDNLEEALISSDVGVTTTLRIIERLQARVRRDKFMNTSNSTASSGRRSLTCSGRTKPVRLQSTALKHYRNPM
jgi:fused signal recognition particle receptor